MDGHVPVSVEQDNAGLRKGKTKVTWCAVCGKRMSRL